MHLGLAHRRYRRSLGGAALMAAAVLGCDANDTVQPIAGLPGADFAIVSNPVSPESPGSSASASAYVSLLPGTLAEAARLVIENERTGQAMEAPVQDGGLDPVAVPAHEGDPLILTIETPGGGPQSFARAVPARRSPRVVRVNPARGRRDVAINASVVVVFSEPVDPATVTDKSLRLEAGDGTVIPGAVGVAADGLSATFVPGQDLAPDTEYRIAVTEDVRDRDGSPVETPVVSSFRTEGIPTAPTPIPPELSSNVIAFRNYLGGIMLISPDGGASVSIFGTSDQDDEPSWSPDGRSLALSRGRYAGAGEIIVLSAEGSGTVRHIGSGVAPAWSPDGSRIAFENHESGTGGIWLMNPDGSGRVRLTGSSEGDGAPAWSPDGRTLAFVRSGEIFVVNADGSDARSLGQVGGSPAWSPDGSRIAFDRLIPADGSWDIWVMNADGSEARRVTNNIAPATSYDPTWSPDGLRIAFAHAPEENIPYQIYVINADGSGMMHVGPDRIDQGLISASYAPAWSPR